ncbi:MAG: Mur ligase family protein [Thermoanaerobaculia bacterium]
MKLLDSRRLTGPNLLLPRAGAVLEVSLEPEEAEEVVAAWQENAGRLLAAVGWPGEEIAVRRFSGGASLAISAPIDSLYSATEVNEQAWAAAEAAVAGEPAPDLAVESQRLRARIAQEAKPSLLALRDAATARSVTLLWDDEKVSVGLGTGSLTWPASSLPDPAAVAWSEVHDVPMLMVTGTNGKTTTVRLLAAIAAAAGKLPGITSTDRIEVGGEVVDLGDYSGPGGARTLLRDRRVEIAILETARGGMLRRGLAVTGAEAALVTNIAADHLGEFGILDLHALAAAKLVVAQAVRPGGRMVLNADDPELLAAAGRLTHPVTWFSLDAANPRVLAHLAAGGHACLLEDGALVLARGSERVAVVRVEEIPVTLGGAARHNVANALGAIGLAAAAGLPVDAMAGALRSLTNNLGRAASMELGGVNVLVDYAHNPHGMAAIMDFASRLPGKRRLLVLGQAGDRNDEAIRELARAAWPLRPERIIVKELPEMLRGRGLGEVPAVLRHELLRLGAAPGSVTIADTELEGIRGALTWAQAGDLLILLVHTQREEVLALLERLRETGWQAGEPLPGA